MQPGHDSLDTPIAMPAAGRDVRLRCGSAELVLEQARGALALLVHDGSEARRYALGVNGGALALQLRPPPYPVLVVPRDTIALAPGGRVRGYFALPLIPTIVWCGEHGDAGVMCELPPPELTLEWDPAGAAVHRCMVPFTQRIVPGAGAAVVPVILCNASGTVQLPAELPIRLRAAELRELRGRIVAAPRRVVLRDDGVSSEVRSFARARGGVRRRSAAGARM